MKKIASIIAGLTLIVVLTSAGNSFFELSKQLDIFGALFKEINNVYVDETEPSKLMRACLDGMLKQLDPYTNYYSESQIENSRIQNSEKLTGIGIYFDLFDKTPVITDLIKDLPADKAGIVSGDKMIAIDGKSTAGKSFDDVSKALKGEAGTTIALTLQRVNGKTEEVAVKRQEFHETNVPFFGMLNKETGLINLKIFNPDAGKDVKDAFQSLKKENPGMKSLIIDLRGNPGGLLNEAVNIVNLFVEKNKLVVTTKGKVAEWNSTFKTLNDPIDTKIPIVVITDNKSASASEIVSGCIQDYDRGVILGQKTYGKGLVQVTKNLSYGTMLKVTTAKYYIPSGRCIQAINYAERNADGSVKKIPDSLKHEFRTAGNRKVFDGGGIDPDVLIEKPEHSPVVDALAKQHLLFDFASLYRSKHESIDNPDIFKLSDKDFEEFVAFVQSKNFTYTSATDKLFAKLKETTSEEKYYDAIKPAYEESLASLSKAKQKDVIANKAEICTLLENEICNRYFYIHGKIEKSLQSDPWVKKALQLLANPKEYNELLTSKK
jgi:carboxyl-terminal processing protease